MSTIDFSAGAASLPDHNLLKDVVDRLLEDLKEGSGTDEDRRQVEDWLRGLSEKYPKYDIERGLRDYYLAEAGRLRRRFGEVGELAEKLTLGRLVESYLEKAAEYDQRDSSEP